MLGRPRGKLQFNAPGPASYAKRSRGRPRQSEFASHEENSAAAADDEGLAPETQEDGDVVFARSVSRTEANKLHEAPRRKRRRAESEEESVGEGRPWVNRHVVVPDEHRWRTRRAEDEDTAADISGADISGADISGADISGADSRAADSSGADSCAAQSRPATGARSRRPSLPQPEEEGEERLCHSGQEANGCGRAVPPPVRRRRQGHLEFRLAANGGQRARVEGANRDKTRWGGLANGPQAVASFFADGAMDPNGIGLEDRVAAKKLVRYALACEFTRTLIRRDAVKKLFNAPRKKQFKTLFSVGQGQLASAFGLIMVELPERDVNSMTNIQRRKLAKKMSTSAQSCRSHSNAWVVISRLPAPFRIPAILTPSKHRSQDGDAAYIALCTLLISTIRLSGGELSDSRFLRFLNRLNIGSYMSGHLPATCKRSGTVERTEIVLKRMVRQGYLIKTVDKSGGEEFVTWHVGPRGKVEVPKKAVANLVRRVYGAPSLELEKRLTITLRLKPKPVLGEKRGKDEGPVTSARSRG